MSATNLLELLSGLLAILSSFVGDAMPFERHKSAEEQRLEPIVGWQPTPNLPPQSVESGSLRRLDTSVRVHRVAPADRLVIHAQRLVPRGPYELEPMEVLHIEVTGAFDNKPNGLYVITSDGHVHLGEKLKVAVHGLTIEQAQTAVTDALQRVAAKPFRVSIALAQMRGLQNIGGEHLVRPDGTISLGMYGSLHVADHTLAEVKSLVEKHLATYLVDPKVSVDVERYSSRNVYFINETGTLSVTALRHTAEMTVFDAFSRVQPSTQDARFQVRVVRITPKGDHVLPVDWAGIVNHGRTETNYELQPGDRIHLSHNPNVERPQGSNVAPASTPRIKSTGTVLATPKLVECE